MLQRLSRRHDPRLSNAGGKLVIVSSRAPLPSESAEGDLSVVSEVLDVIGGLETAE